MTVSGAVDARGQPGVKPNPLLELQRLGQSPWHDNIHRGLLISGTLRKLVRDGDITGLTSNPTIFEQAIRTGADYDDALTQLARRGKGPEEIVDALVVEDIRAAADVFAPVYKRTRGGDGYVSIEVNPGYANDTETTIREVHRLWRAVARPNLMVKIPATRAGIPAIERCIADGLNINITLIFALERYDEVMEAYLGGIAQRLEAGKPVERIASVASFFVSRVDTAVDKLLDQKMAGMSAEERRRPAGLKGRAAIANAKLAYQAFRRKFTSDRFKDLARAGARLQRPLWASTSTKNPAYPDTYYVEALVGPDTVDTMPPQTLAAYKDHGHPENRLEQNVEEAHRVLAALAEVGIHMDAVTQQLEREGVASFARSFDSLVAVVAARREAVLVTERSTLQLGRLERAVTRTLAALDEAHVSERLWQKDATLWKPKEPAAQAEIAHRLGWLDAPQSMRAEVEKLTAFAAAAREAGFTHALLCGMGGSSLAPEVFRKTFGVARGFLDLAVLDSTDPAAVLAAESRSDPARTLYLISSKSGGTVEVNAFLEFFWERVARVAGERAGEHFVAITDPGTSLETLARERHFRQVFLNPPDIGGRYSALSYFGLVPAALIGIDLGKLLDRASRMLRASGDAVRAAHNPGLSLGAVLGTAAKAGRDKMTFLVADKVTTFAAWVEQLLAESTGKDGRGIVPIADEPLGRPRVYGKDRAFGHLHLAPKGDPAVRALARAGHPVATFRLADAYDVAGEFVRWEIATAAAGWVLDINPFDQPNVQESKDNTRALLATYAAEGRLPDPGGVLTADAPELPAVLAAHLRAVPARGYVALHAYLAANPRRERLLAELRAILRERLGVATTLGFGPRFLHSTGQLHKGGPATGVFLQLTCDDSTDVPVPGAQYTFGVLKAAQALGDYQALSSRGRRILRVHLGSAVEEGLRHLLEAVRQASRKTPPRQRPKSRPRRPARRRAARRRPSG
jgi:transaldolase/glucose-6-phosphate isomerase